MRFYTIGANHADHVLGPELPAWGRFGSINLMVGEALAIKIVLFILTVLGVLSTGAFKSNDLRFHMI